MAKGSGDGVYSLNRIQWGLFHKQGSVMGPRNLSVTKMATVAAFQLVLTVGQDSLRHNYPNKRSSEVSSTGAGGNRRNTGD